MERVCCGAAERGQCAVDLLNRESVLWICRIERVCCGSAEWRQCAVDLQNRDSVL